MKSISIQAKWRTLPAPARGEMIRQFGEALRLRKDEVAKQVTLEAKKIISEFYNKFKEINFSSSNVLSV